MNNGRMTAELLTTIPTDKRLFSLEGIDGSGKSTQSKLVTRELIHKGVDVERLASPSASPLGYYLREHLRTMRPWHRHALFVMDMITLLQDTSNDVVVWDRYIDSNIVSNADTTPENSAKWVEALPKPELTFLLDLKPEDVVRLRGRSSHDHSEDLDWQQLKHTRYHRLAEAEPERIIVLDAKERVESLTDTIVTQILNRL